MSAWSRVDPANFRRLHLRAHELLTDVPLHDVWMVELPGGGLDRTLADARAFMSAEKLMSLNPVVRALFQLRSWLGRVFRWDSATRTPSAESYIHHLSDDDRKQSLVVPGSSEGPFTVLYVRPFEAVSEIKNATVHAFSVFAFEPCAGGYRLYWAIYVAPVSRLTGWYMALIDPFRRVLIYPAILRHVHRSWCAVHQEAADQPWYDSARPQPGGHPSGRPRPMSMDRVFLLHHVHDRDGAEDVKLIGVYSSEANAQAARTRLSAQPGFADEPSGFEISPYDLDNDHWVEGFLTVVHVEVPLRGTEETVTAAASQLATGFYQLWPEPDRSTERWLFQPAQTVRCESRRWADGSERLVAIALVSG